MRQAEPEAVAREISYNAVWKRAIRKHSQFNLRPTLADKVCLRHACAIA
jgi:hypothetical protein